MCGFSGFIPHQSIKSSHYQEIISSMTDAIYHRGPDTNGYWGNDETKIMLGFRRLAIQDLSSSGNQPMTSHSNRFVMVFNGEIYNHFDLRQEIEQNSRSNFEWIGTSDTETLLASIDLWGFEASLKKIHGMFAIALYDKKDSILYFARDRFGEKPLYYGTINKSFVFASELKAIKKFPDFNNPISRDALKEYFQYNYIPCPLSIYENIYKLNPGHFLKISINNSSFNINKPEPYWSIQDYISSKNHEGSEGDILSQLEQSIESVVKRQLISDVPLGAFLSGGIDSSLIVSIMQKASSNPIKTFTVGFETDLFNESTQAALVAQHLGTDHTEIILEANKALEVIPNLSHIYDEPFADSSQIPTFLISKIAKEHVTVALSGDGGDEIFGGYNRYLWAPGLWNKISRLPLSSRALLSRIINHIPRSSFNNIQKIINGYLSKAGGVDSLETKVVKLSRALLSKSDTEFYFNLVSHCSDPNLYVKGYRKINNLERFLSMHKTRADNSALNFLSYMMLEDTLSYLPDDILCKVDRASMANSLETRVPFLDHKLAEYAWRLPDSMKVRNGEGKWALRQILYKYVPRSLIDRPKKGFGVPIGEWLRGPLRDWADDLLSKSKIDSQGLLYSEPIADIWEQHLSNKNDWSDQLWGILMFQLWMENNK